MFAPRRALFAAVLLLPFAGPAHAADPYLTGRMLDLTVLVPPPPAKGSPADLADMQAVLDAQASATDERKHQAFVDSDESVYVMFTPVLGEAFTEAATPKAAAMFARIGDSEDDTLDAAKPYFGRVRPWLANPAVQPIAKKTKSGSYPSGHTTRVGIMAAVMAIIVPEKKAEIWARAADYAQSRVIGGMHYPSDIAAGWRTAAAMAAMILSQPGFQADLAAAKAELRAALGY